MGKGTVKAFDAKKGYGFIGTDGGGDVFVHQTCILMDGFRKLDEGQRVVFDIEDTPEGRTRAINVAVIMAE